MTKQELFDKIKGFGESGSCAYAVNSVLAWVDTYREGECPNIKVEQMRYNKGIDTWYLGQYRDFHSKAVVDKRSERAKADRGNAK